VSATFLREVRALALRGHSIAPAVVEGETRRFRVHVVADEAAAAAYRVCFLLPFSGPSPSDLYQRRGLTRPEMRVAELLLQGMSNRSIAARFSRSIETVRKHVSHILRKCDVPNRTAFVAAVTGSRF
jgi:DNA-binding NarL/FixJ family response regulator